MSINKNFSKSRKLNVLVANGVNLDLLGRREPEIYGGKNLFDLEKFLKKTLEEISADEGFKLHFFQSNHEGVFLDELSKGWDGIIINPGAWTHTSLALADRLVGIQTPYVEVHISNVYSREKIRQQSFISANSLGVVGGFGFLSYKLALVAIVDILKASH